MKTIPTEIREKHRNLVAKHTRFSVFVPFLTQARLICEEEASIERIPPSYGLWGFFFFLIIDVEEASMVLGCIKAN